MLAMVNEGSGKGVAPPDACSVCRRLGKLNVLPGKAGKPERQNHNSKASTVNTARAFPFQRALPSMWYFCDIPTPG